jgi:mannitol-specific phosphotransferase system IIBC component
MFNFYIPEGICFAAFVAFSCYTTCFGLRGHLQVCMMFNFYIPEGICFAAFVTFVASGYTMQFLDNKEGKKAKKAHKNQETNEKTTKNTNEKLHSITTCKKKDKKKQIPSGI